MIWQARYRPILGNKTGEPPQEVEVTFDTPLQGAMQGPRNFENAGTEKQEALPRTRAQGSEKQADHDATHGREAGSSTPQVFAPPAAADAKGTLSKASPTHAAVATNTQHPSTPRQPRHARARSQGTSSRNPFANMQDLDFSENAPSPRKRRGLYGGTQGPVDLSYGPLVSNGKVNAPSLSVRKIRGVSEDYGEELSRWIQNHLFYPEDAIANGEEGETSLHVRLNQQGRVTLVRVTNQSGSYALDAAAMSIFSMRAQLPPIPPDMVGDHFDIDLTINYVLIRE